LQDEVNRLFTSSFPGNYGDESIARGTWNPNVDIFENADQLVLEAELPGVKRDDFELTVENNVVTLRGERQFEKATNTDNYHRVERSYGSFTRSFTLPQTVATEEASADYENGVLRVVFPKKEAVKSRKIEVKGAGQPAIEAKAKAAQN
jgi:HSP20 family protein